MTKNPTKLEKTVIDNIKRIRQEKGISQERLSIFCDTSASYIGLMETYKNIPKLSTIERIAEALNVEPIDLFLTDGEKAADSENKQILRERIKEEAIKSLDKSLDEILKLI